MVDEALISSLWRHIRLIARSRGGMVSLIGLVGVAVVCAFMPLADHLGFELAAVLTIVAAVTMPAAGVAAVRRERESGSPAFGIATVSTGLVGVIGVLLATVIILLNGFRAPTCDPISGTVWLVLLPVPTCFLASALGAFAAATLRTTRVVVVAIIAVELGTLLLSLSTLYWGPAFFMFDYLFGYIPGPLYDESVGVTSALWIFRGLTLLWAVALISAVSTLSATNRISRLSRGILGGVLAVGLIVVEVHWGTELGFRSTDESIARTLGGKTEIDDLEIHYPREWSTKVVDEVRHDFAFRAHQVIAELGIKPKHSVTVWLYRGAEEKRRLVGASGTSFAKPWRHEVHINAAPFPHPVVRHELVHAFAGQLVDGPFGVPGGLFPNTPLIEGFAVALEHENEAMTLMQWAKAMRDLHLAPDLTALLSATGFLTAAPNRAYSYAGAFIQFLLERFGRERVLAVYASGDLHKLGDPKQLVAEFDRHLDAITLSPSEKATAERRFSRPSIFRRRCAREVSRITDEAGDLLAEGHEHEAIAEFERACAMEPDDPGLLRSVLQAAMKAKDEKAIKATSAKLLAHPKLDTPLRASVLTDLGDDAWGKNQLDSARFQFTQAAALPVDPQAHRNAYARVVALRDPEREALLKRVFVDNSVDIGQLFRMKDYLAAHPDDALVSYLLGRQLVQHDAIDRGLPLLRKSVAGLDDVEFRREALRMIARSLAEQHQCDAAAATVAEIGAVFPSESDKQLIEDWVERCRFEVARGWKPAQPD